MLEAIIEVPEHRIVFSAGHYNRFVLEAWHFVMGSSVCIFKAFVMAAELAKAPDVDAEFLCTLCDNGREMLHHIRGTFACEHLLVNTNIEGSQTKR